MEGAVHMEKEDYIKLIRVAEGIMKLEAASKIISGHELDEGECYQVYFLWEVLRSNAGEKYRLAKDLEQDSMNYSAFARIIENVDMSAEEKYAALMG
jgi:hypothetical protein